MADISKEHVAICWQEMTLTRENNSKKGIYGKTFSIRYFFLRMALVFGAGYGIRTHDLQLGKLTLYR